MAKTKVLIAECPECESPIRFHSMPRIGKVVVCDVCETSLRVRSTRPLDLDWDDGFELYDDDTEDNYSSYEEDVWD